MNKQNEQIFNKYESLCYIIELIIVTLAKKYNNQGLIHRDIKPKNIFITDDGNKPYGCLGDFGIVKEIGQRTLIKTETGVGTMLYMPLEVLDGIEKASMSLYEAVEN